MKDVMKRLSVWVLMGTVMLSIVLNVLAEDKPAPTSDSTMSKPEVVLPEQEWKQRLTAEQYAVTRLAGTERPYGKTYEEFEAQGEGDYHCVCCGVRLFTSSEKFHSGCGWPSFYDDSEDNNVLEKPDNTHGMMRVETVCKRCGAHLGHVFDGESVSKDTPTNRRFCINGVALVFVPKGEEAPPLLEVESEAVQKKKAEVAEEAGS